MARKLLDAELPDVPGVVASDPMLTGEEKRLYERGLAAAVLGASGLVTARQPLLDTLANADDVSERALLIIALTRLERQGEQPELLREALATTPPDAEVRTPLLWGLSQLVPRVEGLLLPCSFEVARLGAPPLVVEVLASAAEDRAAETLAPQLLELAERVVVANAQAADGLMLAAASLAGPTFFGVVEERQRRRRSGDADGTDEWFEDLAKAYSTCREDLACHSRVLGENEARIEHYKSAQFVAARTPPSQGLAVLELMEDMPRPEWLAMALDQRLSHPTRDHVVRVERLARKGPSALYAPSSQCARLDSPLEELAIRLDLRRRAGE